MSYTFDFDSTNGILRSRIYGRVTADEVGVWYDDCIEHVRRTNPRAGVVDFSEDTLFEPSAQMMRRQTKATPILQKPSLPRIAIAPSLDIYGIMRMFGIEADASRPNFHVVRTEQEAWAILAVKNPRFKSLETL